MREFIINENITLRLERSNTIIYVAGREFKQCKYLLIDIPINHISTFDEIDSIDEIKERLDHSLEPRGDSQGIIHRIEKIPPEVEFWGHCSNLQVWYENNYNTRILDKYLAFPLLKKLTELGDPLAKKVFKEEIAKRFEFGYVPVIEYLLNEKYLEYLDDTELKSIVEHLENKFFDIVQKLIIIQAESLIKNEEPKINLSFLKRLSSICQSSFKNILIKNFVQGNPFTIFYLAYEQYLDLFDKYEFIKILKNIEFDLIEKIGEMIVTLDTTGGLIDYLKRIVPDKFNLIIEQLYQKGDVIITYFLDNEGYGELIDRERYYKYLLVPSEARVMHKLEKMLNRRFWIVYGPETILEDEFVVKDKHINEIVINSKLSIFPNLLFKLKDLKKLYLFMPNLVIPKKILKKLNKKLEKLII